jgi:hypothetical protein
MHLEDNTDDDITWKLMENGQYSVKSAYDAQILGSTFSNLYKTVWKAWASPKVKSFVWLALQNRILMAHHWKKQDVQIVIVFALQASSRIG